MVQDAELVNRLHRMREMNVSFKKKNNTSNQRRNSSDVRCLYEADKQSAHRIDFLKQASLETDNFSGEKSSSDPTPTNVNHHCDQGKLKPFRDLPK